MRNKGPAGRFSRADFAAEAAAIAGGLPILRRLALLVLFLLAAGALPIRADTLPVVREIAFEGNETTRPQTMLREMVIHVGEPADPDMIERSRQAVLDLGLFRAVEVKQEPAAQGGVKLTFTVHEKWYILPLPRLEGNTNGDYGYGGQVRWNNLWGLNHTLRLLAVKRSLQDVDRSGQFSYEAEYDIPFLDDSRYGLSSHIAHTSQDSIAPSGHAYGENFDSAQVLGTRTLSGGPPSRGWNAGTGVLWQRESTHGPFAPPSQGKATGLVAQIGYNDQHYLVYSDKGQRFIAQVQYAADHVASDYSYSRYFLDYRQDWPVGGVQHQDIELVANLGSYFGGAPGRLRNAFGLGGSQRLRGYDTNFVQGDFSYFLSGAFLRPVGWDWLRAMAVVEAGSAYPKLGQTGARPVFVSVGVGVRVRITWLVNVELEGGVAMPLIDHNAPRIFGGKV